MPLVAAHAMTLRPSSPLVAEPPRTRELELSAPGQFYAMAKPSNAGLCRGTGRGSSHRSGQLLQVVRPELDLCVKLVQRNQHEHRRIEAGPRPDEADRGHRELVAGLPQAETIVVAVPQTDAEKRSLRGTAGLPRHDEVTFTAAEIGDQIVSALERRIAMMTEELQKLGVETTPRLREA